MPKKSEFEGYFCSRRNQKSGSEGIGDNVSGFLDEKDISPNLEDKVPHPSSSAVPCCQAQGPGATPAGGQGLAAFPSNTLGLQST